LHDNGKIKVKQGSMGQNGRMAGGRGRGGNRGDVRRTQWEARKNARAEWKGVKKEEE
jgi:hypothetical protein